MVTPGRQTHLPRLAILLTSLALSSHFAVPSLSHASDVRFEQISLDQGLPDVEVHAITQDSRGFVWISTRSGLARFDGYDMVVHDHDPADPTSINGNWVGPLLEDSRGRLWIHLGVGGMDRFDPASGVFDHLDLTPETPALNDFNPSAAIEADNGDMWIATSQLGLHRIGRDDRHDTFLARDFPGLLSGALTDLAIDSAGRLFVASCGGISVLEPGVEPKKGVEGFQPVFEAPTAAGVCITSLLLYESESGERILWAAFGARLLRLEPGDGSAVESFLLPRAETGPAGFIAEMAVDASGRPFVGVTGRGLFALESKDGGSWQDFPFAPPDSPAALPVGRRSAGFGNAVNFLQADESDAIWVATFGSGLYRLSPDRREWQRFHEDAVDPHSLATDRVATGFADRAGNLWFGTNDEGISLYSPWRFKFPTVRWDPLRREGLLNPTIFAMAETRGALYIGTYAGLEVLDPETGRRLRPPITHFPPPVSALEVDASEAHGGELWVGTGNAGLYRYDPTSETVLRLPPGAGERSLSHQGIRSLRFGLDGRTLFIGTNNGFVDRLDTESMEIDRAIFSARADDGRWASIWNLLDDPSGYLWVGTPSFGLHRIELATLAAHTYTFDPDDPTSINNRTVNSLHLDSRGRLWVGTYSGGLDLHRPETDDFVHLTEVDGLPDLMIEAIVEQPDGVLWLATRHDLVRYEPDAAGPAPRLTAYGRRDGLGVSAFRTGAGLRLSNGDLVFGGLGGVVRVHPDSLRSNPHVPPVVLTEFFRRNEAGKVTSRLDAVREVEVLPGDRTFGFVFATLDFADPERNRYAYWLEGYDEDWTEAGSANSATYTNIDPGDYVFRVRGASADGVWNLDGASVRVRVVPPFWRTPWFRALQGIAILALLAAAFLLQRQRLERRARQRAERSEHERKTRELDLARQVQRSLLPEGDYDDGRFEAVGRLRTASEVGGDYFDVIRTESGRLCVALGDAIGHGMAAGLVVGMAKAALLEGLRTPGRRAADLLEGLDSTLRGAGTASAPRGRAGSASCGRSHPMAMGLTMALIDEDGRVDLASAAMPFPYHWHADDGRLESLELIGSFLGHRLGPARSPSDIELRLKKGDALILISDGMVERPDSRDEPWGFDALEAELGRLLASNVDTRPLAQSLFEACDRHAGGRDAEDDLTVMVVRRIG